MVAGYAHPRFQTDTSQENTEKSHDMNKSRMCQDQATYRQEDRYYGCIEDGQVGVDVVRQGHLGHVRKVFHKILSTMRKRGRKNLKQSINKS